MDIGGFHIHPWIGVGASAGAVFTAVYGLFSRFEKIQSRDNRRYVGRLLLGLQVPDRGSEIFFIDLFNKLFGPRHWSIRCALTSFVLSAFLIIVTGFAVRYGILHLHGPVPFNLPTGLMSVSIPLLCLCLLDYFSLWKTRLFLTRVSALRNTLASVGFIVADFTITSVLFGLSFLLTTFIGFVYIDLYLGIEMFLYLFWFWDDWIPYWITYFESPFYLVALLTSAWLWAYVAAAQAMRLLAYVPSFIKLLSKITDIKEHPVRVLGFVAGLLSAFAVIIFNVFVGS